MRMLMEKAEWIYCPVCKGKTRLQMLKDTEMRNFPLYCPKCKQESLIDVKAFQITKSNIVLNRS